jgi:hypothetical protein
MMNLHKRFWRAYGLYPFLVLLITCRVGYAGTRPSFVLDYSAWKATHIVLVETTDEDGRFEVVESWKGDLKPGESITIPEMRPGPNAVPIARYPADAST